MATTENPSFAEAPDAQPSGGRADLEVAVALLNVKDGNEAETVETLESLMIAREAELWSTALAELLVSVTTACFNVAWYSVQTWLITGWQVPTRPPDCARAMGRPACARHGAS